MIRGDRDRGAGAVLTLAVVAVGVLLLSTLTVVGSAVLARGAAQAGADLSALAAAGALREAVEPCAVARECARRNGVDLTGCEIESAGAVRVSVARASGWGSMVAQARAGPRPLTS